MNERKALNQSHIKRFPWANNLKHVDNKWNEVNQNRKISLKNLKKNGVKRRLVVLACKLITQSSAESFERCGLGTANQNIFSSISCRWITSGALWAAAANTVTDGLADAVEEATRATQAGDNRREL